MSVPIQSNLPVLTQEQMKEAILKSHKKLTFKYRCFAVGFLAGILAVAASAYSIHPGLGAMVITGYLTYFARINLVTVDEKRYQIEQTIFAAAAKAIAKPAGVKPEHGLYV